MPNIDPIKFTDRERFLANYYRSSDLSNSRRRWLYDGAYILGSFVCIVLLLLHDDLAFGFIAYGLVLGRLLYILVEGRRWSQDFRGLLTKYDAKVSELTEALSR